MSSFRAKGDSRPVGIVAIGGGTGLSTLLSGLKHYVGDEVERLSAIVAVTDDGGSSGRLRGELRVLPPGDIRNCMVALSEDSHLLSQLFRYRFRGEGHLSGHNFGNLFLAALSEITGDFAEAVRLSSEILASKGHLFPATNADVRIAARLSDGSLVRGETKISQVGASIERVMLDPPDCEPMPAAIEAIRNADLITVGPGSLFTSILPPLLVKGVCEAIRESRATKIFICNLMTQPGETDGLSSSRHFELVSEHVPALTFDYILVNNKRISDRQAEVYAVEGAEQIGIHGSIVDLAIDGPTLIYDNLLDDGEKVRHHPEKLAAAVLSCMNMIPA